MSANIFKAFGPIGQLMGPIGSAALCNTEFYPVGLTASELMDWYWMTRYVDAQCAASANVPGNSADFPGGVVDGPVMAPFDRRNLITNGAWQVEVPESTSGGGTNTAICSVQVFVSQSAPNNYSLAYDGSLWYPCILVAGQAVANDGVNNGGVSWDSRTTTNPLGTAGNAVILGKNIPLSYDISLSGSGTANFASPTLTKDSDWPYV